MGENEGQYAVVMFALRDIEQGRGAAPDSHLGFSEFMPRFIVRSCTARVVICLALVWLWCVRGRTYV